MALSKNEKVLGFDSDVYIKVSAITARESGKDEDGKLYALETTVDFYTNDTKDFHYKQESKVFSNVRAEDLNFVSAYTFMKGLEEFSESVDV